MKLVLVIFMNIFLLLYNTCSDVGKVSKSNFATGPQVAGETSILASAIETAAVFAGVVGASAKCCDSDCFFRKNSR